MKFYLSPQTFLFSNDLIRVLCVAVLAKNRCCVNNFVIDVIKALEV